MWRNCDDRVRLKRGESISPGRFGRSTRAFCASCPHIFNQVLSNSSRETREKCPIASAFPPFGFSAFLPFGFSAFLPFRPPALQPSSPPALQPASTSDMNAWISGGCTFLISLFISVPDREGRLRCKSIDTGCVKRFSRTWIESTSQVSNHVVIAS